MSVPEPVGARDDLAGRYRRDGYVELPGLVDPGFCGYLTAYLVLCAQSGRMTGDDTIPGALVLYGDPAFEVLLTSLADVVARHVGAELVPTYSFARIYQDGGALAAHTDRPACEHSVSLHLGSSGNPHWPLRLDDLAGRTVSVEQAPGDALAYQGTRLRHWRDPYAGEWYAQVFLHWVRADGPHVDELFDHRPALGMPPSSKRATPTRLTDAR